MRRFVSLATLLVASAMLAGCPIYPVDSCYSSYDCPNGYTCDSYLGQCVAEPGDDDDDDDVSDPVPPLPQPPPDRTDECSSPVDCAEGETCGEKGFCLPGDCTFWGCVSGFTCAESAEGKAFVCVEEGTGGGGGEVSCSSSLTAPPASGTLSFADEVAGEKFSFCLASLDSDPSTSRLLAGGELGLADSADAERLQQATLTIEGQIASSETILCNANPETDGPSAKCSLVATDHAIRQVTYESAVDRPFTIRVETWTDTAFVGVAELTLLKTLSFSGRPDVVRSEIETEVQISVHSRVLEDGEDDVNDSEGGGRPPPAP